MTNTSDPKDTASTHDVLRKAALAMREMREKLHAQQAQIAALESKKNEPIAVIGMGCRLPGGANNPDAYWDLLSSGTDAIGPVPDGRWDSDVFYDPNPDTPGRTYTKMGGYIDNLSMCDPSFFGISPREAVGMDPQQRLLLEVAWEALENAGIAADTLKGSKTGVFVGISAMDYAQRTLYGPHLTEIDAYSGTGIAFSVAAGRVSYVLGLEGPSMAVDTACSSSLVTTHLAIQSLRSGECNLALAGGVNALLQPETMIYFSKLQAISTDGRCKTFDAAANGYARGEGCGILALKRLSDAERDGDRILALLRGSAINHDGRSGGLTVPNGPSQERVIRSALDDAQLSPRDVNYIEAHGTGTPLGDPIEVHALANVLCADRQAEETLLLGSSKTNIGHLEPAAGSAGLIKVILSMQKGQLPPHLHFKEWNPHIDIGDAPIEIVEQLTDWPSGNRIAGISSFGISGTNAHIIIGEAPTLAEEEKPSGDNPILYPLSARNAEALVDMAAEHASFLSAQGAPSLEDAAYTVATGRAQFAHRLAVSAPNSETAFAAITAAAKGEDHPNLHRTNATQGPQKLAFLFTGQGSQYAGMGRSLYKTSLTFRKTLDRCEAVFKDATGTSLIDVLHAEESEGAKINQTGFTQPALYCLQVALVDFWAEQGLHPYAVLGHSVGEFAAAYAAGILTLEEGLELITVRGSAMQSLPAGGEMAAVFADHATVESVVASYAADVSIAAINGPRLVVISGSGESIRAVLSDLDDRNISHQKLVVSHAFHSPLMNPILDQIETAASEISYADPRILFVSTLTGEILPDEGLTPAYWRRHAAEPVRFAQGIQTLAELGCTAFLEIGPMPTLCGIGQSVVGSPDMLWVPSLRRGRDDRSQTNDGLAMLFANGVDVDWQGVCAETRQRKVSLPTYPFQREEFWANSTSRHTDTAPAVQSFISGGHPLLGGRLQIASKEVVFQSQIDAAHPSFLSDHQVCGATVFPGAGYWELGLAAGQAAGLGARDLVSVALEEPLLLEDGVSCTLQVVVEPDTGAGSRFGVYSLIGLEDQSGDTATEHWRRHATGTLALRQDHDERDNAAINLSDLLSTCQEEITLDSHFDFMSEHGLDYGPAFQGIRALHKAEGRGLARIELGEGHKAEAEACQVHPALLDACLQTMGAALPAPEDGSTYLPLGVDRLTLLQQLPTTVWCDARVRDGFTPGAEAISGDLRLYDEAGVLVGKLEGVRLKRATKLALMRAAGKQEAHWEHVVEWVPVPSSPANVKGEHWLILTDEDQGGGSIGEALAKQLERAGASSNAISALGVELSDSDAVSDVVTAALANVKGQVSGIVYLWGLNRSDENTSDVDGDVDGGHSVGALHVIQALSRGSKATVGAKLWLATRGAQPVSRSRTPLSAAGGALWGLGRVVANELPDLSCRLVDLDPAPWENPVEAMLDALQSDDGEQQIGYRDGLRYAARLVKADGAVGTPQIDRRSVQLQIPQRGTLDDLVLAPVSQETLGAGQVRLSVRGAGLNFRDVLNALGMYPGDPGPLGGECAGVITDIGPDVKGLNVGDCVLAIVPGCFRNDVVAKAALTVPIPAELDIASAAGVPIAFLTAHYALRKLSNLQKGESVLIHAGSGGVGIAAIQIAQNIGAKIFTTAGSPRKREYLRRLGVEHIFDSRALDFADEIRAVTKGVGVDCVLNSLAGEAIDKSLSLLSPRGRFVEIGKTDLWTQERAQDAAPGVSYMPFALDDLVQTKPQEVGAELHALMEEFSQGKLRALPTRMFDLAKSIDAFRFMQQARHIGKIVITQAALPQDVLYSSDRSYLITGGGGALGRSLARHIARAGAGAVILTGRSKPSDDINLLLADLKTAGTDAVYLRCDVAKADDVQRVMDQIASDLPPLAGLFHAAGVLDDRILLQQDAASFERVLAPKAKGAWNLHKATEGMPLNFFVLFSSASAVLGASGQGNYAAANAYLDSLAHARSARGQVATSINWGAWSGAGMAADLDAAAATFEKSGIEMIEPQDGFAAMDDVLKRRSPQELLMPIRWDTFFAQMGGAIPSVLTALVGTATNPKRETATAGADPAAVAKLMEKLRSVPSANRTAAVQDIVCAQAVRVLGLETGTTLDAGMALQDAGLDSLMAVELRNGLASAFGVALPATLLFDYPSLHTLAGYMTNEILELSGQEPQEVDDDVDELEVLSDLEVEASLLDELNDAGY